MNTKEEIGKRLRTLLDVLDVKANVFAVDWLGYDSPSKYYNWHNGKFKPKDDFYNELESAVFIKTGKKVNTDWVRRGQGEMFASESAQEAPKDPINPGPASDGYNATELKALMEKIEMLERYTTRLERQNDRLEKKNDKLENKNTALMKKLGFDIEEDESFPNGAVSGKVEAKLGKTIVLHPNWAQLRSNPQIWAQHG